MFRRDFMKPVFFIAKKFHSSSTGDLRYSKPIIRIATAGVAVGIVVMLFSIAIANGFKREISDNVAAANAHFKILPLGFKDNPDIFLQNAEQKTEETQALPGVAYSLATLYQPVLLEKDSEIYGLVLKGGNRPVPSSFKDRFLKEGIMPDTLASGLCLSKKIAQRLSINLGDVVNVYITNQGAQIKKRRLKLVGIFETGVPGIDEEMAFANNNFILDLNPNIPEISLQISGEKTLKLKNNLGLPISVYRNSVLLGKSKEAEINLAGGDLYSFTLQNQDAIDSIACNWVDSLNILHRYNNKNTLAHAIEIYSSNFDNLDILGETLLEETDYSSQLTSIQEDFPEIFNWLNLLDTNVVVLLLIMAIVSLVNMASALLVLIIEKTNAIALLKTMGAATKLIRQVFLSIAAFILFRGILIGNLIACTLLYLQYQFQFIKLDQEQYYVAFVPVKINALEWLSVNIGTMLFCLIVLILPTLLIARIYPAKALRIE